MPFPAERIIPFSLPDADYCHNLFQLLTWKNAFPGAHNERITGQLLQLLFSELQEASLKIPGSLSSHYHELVNLRKSIYNSPQLPWSVPDMARQLHLSEGYMQVVYKNTFGISCMDDCINARIRLAKDRSGGGCFTRAERGILLGRLAWLQLF